MIKVEFWLSLERFGKFDMNWTVNVSILLTRLENLPKMSSHLQRIFRVLLLQQSNKVTECRWSRKLLFFPHLFPAGCCSLPQMFGSKGRGLRLRRKNEAIIPNDGRPRPRTDRLTCNGIVCLHSWTEVRLTDSPVKQGTRTRTEHAFEIATKPPFG